MFYTCLVKVIQKTLPASPVVSQHEPSLQVNTRTAQVKFAANVTLLFCDTLL